MSLLLGTRTERLPLDQAVDQLVAAARWAAVPSSLWVAGLLFPEVIDIWAVVRETVGSVASLAGVRPDFARGLAASWGQFQPVRLLGDGAGTWIALLAMLPLALVAARLSAGLARLAGDGSEGDLGAAWRRGAGHARATVGLWLLLAGLLATTLLVLVLPLVGLAQTFDLDTWSPLLVLVVTPPLLIVFAYAALLQIVQQLALQSLVQNERGVASALTHGWRLVRNAPWSAVRAASCDLVLVLLALAAGWLVDVLHGLSEVVALVLALALAGYLGTVRAGFWARVYRALGGQVAGDPLHGLGD